MGSDLFKFRNSKASDDIGAPIETIVGAGKQQSMSDATFIDLREVIYKLCGIYYTDGKKYLLEGRIAKRLIARNMHTYEEYVEFLKSPYCRQEINQLFEAITINETYFFRAEQQFDAFEKIIVPEILKLRSKESNPTFRVWSSASSTGEEPYTLAILIKERLKPLFPNVNFQILGSDINNSVLETARLGIYKDYSIRNVPQQYLMKYFKKQGNTYHISQEIKSMVRFMNINLFDPIQMRSINGCDVIFCCNVLIYFDIPSKQQVVSYIYDSLNKGGYLMIGYSESLHGISKAFKLVHLPKAMAYKKD